MPSIGLVHDPSIGWGGGSCMVGFQKSGPTLDGSDKVSDELISTNVAKQNTQRQPNILLTIVSWFLEISGEIIF